MAERFWFDRSKDTDAVSVAGSEFPGSQASNASHKSAATAVLKDRLASLESQLEQERTARLKVEADLAKIKPGEATLSTISEKK